jgi:hypothetical protein
MLAFMVVSYNFEGRISTTVCGQIIEKGRAEALPCER